MNIAFTIDNKYIIQLMTTIVSILENNNLPINFFILHSNISNINKQKLSELEFKYPNGTINFINIDENKFNTLPITIDYIGTISYYRYIIADIINEEKALYLDSDIIVKGDISRFYNTNISEYYAAGVEDLYIKNTDHKNKIGFSEQDLYINGGVLLLNLKKLKQENISAQLFENTVKYKDSIKYQDQDIINITFKNKILELDSIYNFASENVKKQKNKIKNAKIIHYTGSKKPWDKDCKNKLKNEWKKYNKLLSQTTLDKLLSKIRDFFFKRFS